MHNVELVLILLAFAVILATLVGQGLTFLRLDDLEPESWVPQGVARKLRYHHEHALGHRPESLERRDVDDAHIADLQRLHREVVHAQPVAIIALRDRGDTGDDALRRVEQFDQALGDRVFIAHDNQASIKDVGTLPSSGNG